MRGRNQLGFTLIELMVVIAIVGALAAAAIPVFQSQQLRSKRAEGMTNVNAIMKLSKVYFGEIGALPLIGTTWPGGGSAPTKQPLSWDAGGRAAFAPIGFDAEGDIRYRYDLDAGVECPCTSCFTIAAYSNLDGDGTIGGIGFFQRDSAPPRVECPTAIFGWTAPLDGGGTPQYESAAVWPQVAGGADDY